MHESTGVRLRGHHLICLHFYRGEGYDARFVANLSDVLSSVEHGPVTVVSGADDVCAGCAGLRGGRCTTRPDMEAEVRQLDRLALELLRVEAGDVVTFAELRELLPGVLGEWKAEACADCEWAEVCAPRMDAEGT